MRVAINGFGRIGRALLRILADRGWPLEVVAINDITDPATLSHLFKYDSVHRIFPQKVSSEGNVLRVGDRSIPVLAQRDPAELPWADLSVDLVMECTGRFRKLEEARRHLDAGCRKVILSAPAKGEMPTFVYGVNHEEYEADDHHMVSNASCTTNCLAPAAKVVHRSFGIAHGLMTTIHAYTNDQRILDLPHKDLRRARAAAVSMIPTTTGAAQAVGLVLPQLRGKLDGMSVRVPTPNVSLVDLVATLERPATASEVNQALQDAASGDLAGVLGFSEEPLVSIDYLGNPFSSTVDSQLTRVIDERLLKLILWYDNEWGFSNRMVDLALYMLTR